MRFLATTYKDKVKIHTICHNCNVIEDIEVKNEDYYKYEAGEMVQNAFPYLSKDEREQIISGTCKPCWNEIFATVN